MLVADRGKLLASGVTASKGQKASIRIWHLASRSLVAELREHKNEVRVIAFSESSQFVASADSEKMVAVWRPSNKEIVAMKKEPEFVTLCFVRE